MDSITTDDNGDGQNCDCTTVSKQAQAIQMYSGGDGGGAGNTILHQKMGEPLTQEEKDTIVEGEVRPPHEPVVENAQFKVGSYYLIEEALNDKLCVPVTTYSGSEYNQDDLYGELEELGFNNEYTFKDTDPNILRQKEPKELIGQEIINYGFMSTSISESHAREFLTNVYSGGFKTTILYVLHVDSSTHGLYISNPKNYARHPLSGGGEYQLLLNLKLKIKITNAGGETGADKTQPSVLHIEADAYH